VLYSFVAVVFFGLVGCAATDYGALTNQRHCMRGRSESPEPERLRVRVVWRYLAGYRGAVSGSRWTKMRLLKQPVVRRQAAGLCRVGLTRCPVGPVCKVTDCSALIS
jgi:hypothetical protein